MRAWRNGAMGLFVVLGAACGSDPLPMTGQAFWQEGCPSSTMGLNCNTGSHFVRGTAGSASVDVECNVVPVTGGTSILFRVATIGNGQNFAESTEGLYVTGVLPAPGQELSSDGGYVQVQGAGWHITPEPGTSGVTGACHVFIDRLSGQNFSGRLKCTNVVDDLSPPHTRYLSGQVPQTQSNDYAEFTFSNCESR